MSTNAPPPESVEPGPSQGAPSVVPAPRLGRWGIFLLGMYFIFLGPLMVYVFILFWPPPARPGVRVQAPRSKTAAATSANTNAAANTNTAEGENAAEGEDLFAENISAGDIRAPDVYLFGSRIAISKSYEIRMMIMVCLGGAIGAYLRSAMTFASYAETASMPHPQWVWWCLLQTFIGMILALIFYLITRGTSVSAAAGVQDVNVFTTVGIACLVGLFAKQATDKLAAFFAAVSTGAAPIPSDKQKEQSK